MRKLSAIILIGLCLVAYLSASAEDPASRTFPAYRSELNVVYAKAGGREVMLKTFLPKSTSGTVPAIVEIHGGWLFGCEPAMKCARRQ
jgi:hypothetical protein